MSDRPNRPARPAPYVLEVVRTETVAEDLVRVWFSGPGIASYRDNAMTDRYVKLLVPPAGVTYDDPGDNDTIATLPAAEQPKVRTYTVRHWDEVAGELAIDFVLHGDAGVAAPWSARAQPGDRLAMRGPGGAYTPDLDADWHLFIGDDAALPAIDAALQALPDDARVVGVIELAQPNRASYLDDRFLDCFTLLGPDSDDLVATVERLAVPEGVGHAFAHGELSAMRDLRAVLAAKGLTPDRLSLSGYWRRGKDEDGFQAEKREHAVREQAGA